MKKCFLGDFLIGLRWTICDATRRITSQKVDQAKKEMIEAVTFCVNYYWVPHLAPINRAFVSVTNKIICVCIFAYICDFRLIFEKYSLKYWLVPWLDFEVIFFLLEQNSFIAIPHISSQDNNYILTFFLPVVCCTYSCEWWIILYVYNEIYIGNWKSCKNWNHAFFTSLY